MAPPASAGVTADAGRRAPPPVAGPACYVRPRADAPSSATILAVSGIRRWWWVALFAAICAAAYAAQIHRELADFEVYRTAGRRALAAEALYREADGHYQFKYLPAFALAMTPIAALPPTVARPVWFALSATLLALFVRFSLAALPERRRPASTVVLLTVVFMAKFYAHELTLGQTNLLLGVMLVGSLRLLGRGSTAAAAALAAAAVFVKPYALVLLPWLAWAGGATAAGTAGLVLAAGLAVPALVYGWSGNLELLHGWYATVTGSTAGNLLGNDNVSLAAMWAKWIGPGPTASGLAAATAGALLLFALLALLRGRPLRHAAFFDVALLLTIVPLLSPQGWDYVLLLATPAVMLIVDRWHELGRGWRLLAAAGLAGVGLTIYDLLGRELYGAFMAASGVTVAVLTGVLPVLARLRWMRLS